MNAIRFWMDVRRGRNGARLAACYIAAWIIATIGYGASQLVE